MKAGMAGLFLGLSIRRAAPIVLFRDDLSRRTSGQAARKEGTKTGKVGGCIRASDLVIEHLFVVTVPIALESLLGVVSLFQA